MSLPWARTEHCPWACGVRQGAEGRGASWGSSNFEGSGVLKAGTDAHLTGRLWKFFESTYKDHSDWPEALGTGWVGHCHQLLGNKNDS